MNSPLITIHEDPTDFFSRSPRYTSWDVPAYLNMEGSGRPVPEELPGERLTDFEAGEPWEPPAREQGEHGDEINDREPIQPVEGKPAEEGGRVTEAAPPGR